MYAGKDAANAAYPTQWALNPSAYQNVDSSQVDWAALAQQWIAMKEAAAIVAGPQSKGDIEEGEAPMEVENPDTNSELPTNTEADWSTSNNSWDGTWNQWGNYNEGWGWSGSAPVDPKIAADPSIAIPPMMDGYSVPDNTSSMQGYTTGTNVPAPTFQHGYWTAPQMDTTSGSRSSSRSIDRRSKSKNRDSKSSRSRSHRDKPPIVPPVIEPIVMPTPVAGPTIDAAKRRQLPAWIREGLEKMEKEKQKAIEREQEKKAREEAELEKKRLEEEELERLKAAAGGQPILPAKSKFDTDSDAEGSDNEDQNDVVPDSQHQAPLEPETEPEEKPTLIKKSKEEIMQEVMLAVRRSLTEILLDVTDQEIHTVSQEELARFTAAQASRINAMKASKSKALAAITTGLGLGAYESSDESEDESNDLTDHQLQDIIRRKKLDFERTAREIEAEVRRAEIKEVAEENSSPVSATPERPRRLSRSSETPPPAADNETPEKKPEIRAKDRRSSHSKPVDRIDNSRKLETIAEEKVKRSLKYEGTPSPHRIQKNDKESSSSSSDSEDDSSSSSDSSSESASDFKLEDSRPKKRKRKSTSSPESQKKTKKNKKEKSIRSNEKSYSKSKYDEYEKSDKSKSKRKDEHYEKHKSYSRSRDEKSYRDKYRDDSDEDKPRKRSKRSRSVSYESRSGRRKTSRDRSEEKSRRRDQRDKRSYDRDSSKRDRSYDRSGREYERHDRQDRHDRYERSREYERRRSRSGSYARHRR